VVSGGYTSFFVTGSTEANVKEKAKCMDGALAAMDKWDMARSKTCT
jgi:hypothetical protein